MQYDTTEAKRLADAADKALEGVTPGEWSARVDETATFRDDRDNQLGMCTYLHTKTGGRRNPDEVAANANFIAYARSGVPALAASLRDATAEIARKDERIAALEKALAFYANPEVYKPHPHGPAFDRRDLSFHAEAALKDMPSDGSCVRCGAVPRNASGLCATCLDEDAEREGETL